MKVVIDSYELLGATGAVLVASDHEAPITTLKVPDLATGLYTLRLRDRSGAWFHRPLMVVR